MARARAEVDNHKLIDGKWFCRAGDWILPYSRPAISALRVRQRFVRTTTQNAYQSIDARKPREVLRKVRRLYREINQRKTMLYNAQPRWLLSDIQIESSSDVPQVIEEFLQLVEFAAADFCWTLNPPLRAMDWKRHAWKHTTFAEIERIIADVNAGRWLPPQMTIDQLGSFDAARTLFRRAVRREPDAVARVESLFPSAQDKNLAARHLFDLSDEEPVPCIPSVRSLAGTLAEVLVRSPDSPEAEQAREELHRLVSIQAVKGSRAGGGQPPSPHHEEIVITTWMMCYAVAKQIREVDRFLCKHESNQANRHIHLSRFYPQLDQHKIALSDVLDRETVRSAFGLAGKFLRLSASKVEKVAYPRRPRA